MKDKIYIRIKNEYLDIEDSVSIQFVWNSPLFDTDILKGSYSYPFNISMLSEKNRRLLGRPDDVKNTEKIKPRIDCVLGLFGKEYSAYLKTTSARRLDSAEVSIFLKDSVLVSSKEKSIRSFDLGTIDLYEDVPYKEAQFLWTAGAYQDEFNIELNNFYYETGLPESPPVIVDSPVLWAYVRDILISKINEDTDQHFLVASVGEENTPGDGYPMLKVTCVNPGVNQRLEITRKYDPSEVLFPRPLLYRYTNFSNGPALVDLMLDSLINPERKFVFAPMFFDNMYTDTTYIWNHVVNYWDGLTFQYRVDDTETPIIPLPYFKYVSIELFKSLGYKIIGSFFSDEELSSLVFFNTVALDNATPVMYNDDVYLIDIKKTNVYPDQISIQNHLPDISLSQFISMHRNNFAAYYIFNHEEKTVKISFLGDVVAKNSYKNWEGKSLKKQKPQPVKESGVTLKYTNDSSDNAIKTIVPSINGRSIKSPVATFDDLPIFDNKENDLRLVIGENSYYYVTYELIGSEYKWNWYFYSVNLYDYVYEGGSLQIDSGNSLHMMKEVDSVPMPYFDQQATSLPYGQPGLNFTSRLMFYRGLKNHLITFPFPSLISSPTITREADEDENYSMQWDGEKGLYEKRYKKWLKFRTNTVPVDQDFELTDSDLNTIEWDEWYRSEGVDYLIEKIQFSVSKTKTSTVIASLYARA